MANPTPQKSVDKFALPKGGPIKKLMYIMAFVGPASMICSTSMGPGTATSCIQAGSMFGYDLLWVIVLSGIMCGGVAYIGAKVTAISGQNVFDFIQGKIGKVASSILFIVVLCTWYMVIYSQGATMRHLNDIMFGEQGATIAYVITILIIAYLYVASSNNRIIKIASKMGISTIQSYQGAKIFEAIGLNTLLALADDGLAVEPTQTGSPFPSKQCAMMFTVRPNITSYAGSLTDAEGNATIDFVSMPAFEGVENFYIGMGCTGYAISKQCAEDKRDLAWDFLKFVMTEDGQNAFCESGAGVPVLVSMANDTEASWRQYLPEANHDAFIQYDTRDLPMTEYLNGIDPSKHIAVRTVLTDNMTKNLFSAGDRNSYYSQLSEMLMNALR